MGSCVSKEQEFEQVLKSKTLIFHRGKSWTIVTTPKYESDGLIEYFAQGMSGTFTENIDSLNGVVNGGKNAYV